MTMDKDEAFAIELFNLAKIFPAHAPDADAIEAYRRALDCLSAEDLRRASNVLARTRTYPTFPRPAEILEAALGSKNNLRDNEWLALLDDMKSKCRHCEGRGYIREWKGEPYPKDYTETLNCPYCENGYPIELGEKYTQAAKSAVRAMGGLSVLRSFDNNELFRYGYPRFRSLWDSYSEVTQPKLLDAARALLLPEE